MSGDVAAGTTRVLPKLISLTPEAVAEALAEWLTEQVDDDGRSQGVVGPLDGTRVVVLLRGGELLIVDVALGEVVSR